MVGFVVPMEKEARGLLERLENSQRGHFKGRTLFSGVLGDTTVKVLISGCGKVRSASTTQLLLDSFDCSSVIHFGSAGAISPALRIGDLVIGDEIVEYDYYSKFGEPEPTPISYSSSVFASRFQEWAKQKGIHVVRGKMLSGNEDVVTTPRRNELIASYSGLSVDWESGACAFVCNSMNVPVLVLRGIVDYAYEETHREFSENLGSVSCRLGELIAEFVTEEGELTITAVADATAYGIDVSLIDVNLELSPQIRIERHESALELVNELRKAGAQLFKA